MCLAVPGQVVSVSDAPELERTGKVSFSGVMREVSLAFIPDVQPGEWVIVHVGFALSRLDEQEALETLDLLREAIACEPEKPDVS
jgi:hydrogenase expression/formation protein HypC